MAINCNQGGERSICTANDDIIEMHSSADNESNRNTEDQLEAEKSNNSLTATNERSELSPKKSELETPKE